MPRSTLTREDWAEFTEITGFYKANGETLVALRKIREGKFHIALSEGEPFYGHLIRDDSHNISAINRTDS